VVKKHEQPTRHGAAHGLGWGLAVGAACAPFPRSQLGEVLETGRAGLIVVYATNMADQVAANIKAVSRRVSKEIDANADELARQLQQAETHS
jgi:hypothetical protein